MYASQLHYVDKKLVKYYFVNANQRIFLGGLDE